MFRSPLAGAHVLLSERPAFGVGRVLLFDIQAWLILVLGGLLALITLLRRTAMSTSPSTELSHSISKSEYYSSLPWFRRLLAMLNWRPVVDYELRDNEFAMRKIAHEQRMKQLKSENARIAELNSKLDAILFSSDTRSTSPRSTQGE